MIDSWFRLQGREASEHVTGEIRVAIKYQVIEVRNSCSCLCYTITRFAQTSSSGVGSVRDTQSYFSVYVAVIKSRGTSPQMTLKSSECWE